MIREDDKDRQFLKRTIKIPQVERSYLPVGSDLADVPNCQNSRKTGELNVAEVRNF